MRKVISVKPNQDYTLEIEFDNGEKRIFDVSPFLDKGIFKELKNLTYFKRVRVSLGAVEWPHGQDFSPDTLYLLSKEKEAVEE